MTNFCTKLLNLAQSFNNKETISAFFWNIMQRIVVIPCRRLRTTYRSHLQGSRNLKKIGPVGCPETSIRNYYYRLCNNPEERRSHLLRNGSLKSRNRDDSTTFRQIPSSQNKREQTDWTIFYFKDFNCV